MRGNTAITIALREYNQVSTLLILHKFFDNIKAKSRPPTQTQFERAGLMGEETCPGFEQSKEHPRAGTPITFDRWDGKDFHLFHQ